jgi:hypothetical protein
VVLHILSAIYDKLYISFSKHSPVHIKEKLIQSNNLSIGIMMVSCARNLDHLTCKIRKDNTPLIGGKDVSNYLLKRKGVKSMTYHYPQVSNASLALRCSCIFLNPIHIYFLFNRYASSISDCVTSKPK